MPPRRAWLRAVLVVLACSVWQPCAGAAPNLPLEKIKLPPGYKIELYVQDSIPGARSLVLSPARANGVIVFVGSTAGKVYAIVDKNGDGRADFVCVLIDNLQAPHGITYRAGSLYVGEPPRLTRWDKVDAAALSGRSASGACKVNRVAQEAILCGVRGSTTARGTGLV